MTILKKVPQVKVTEEPHEDGSTTVSYEYSVGADDFGPFIMHAIRKAEMRNLPIKSLIVSAPAYHILLRFATDHYGVGYLDDMQAGKKPDIFCGLEIVVTGVQDALEVEFGYRHPVYHDGACIKDLLVMKDE